jgi:octaprenyl-diphosphate synthase
MTSSSPLPRGATLSGLPEVLAPVADDLERVGARYAEILEVATDRVRDVVSQAARFGGKRLRPALTCLAARAAGSAVTSDVATVAAVVELIHTATLVHDDVLDGAQVRRKVATLNARWGEQLAVLGGDVLFSKAYRAAAYLSDPFASRYLSDVVGEILEGEIHQDLVARRADLGEAEYLAIIRGKTAALYEAALVVGAHYGGAPAALAQALGRYGHHLGLAFQIVDDRLDLTGDEAEVGKSLGQDLGEGKTTLPLILWRDAVPAAQRAEARALMERAWDDPEAARRLAARLVSDGALRAADDVARREAAAAQAALAGVPAGPSRDLLVQLADYVVARSL